VLAIARPLLQRGLPLFNANEQRGYQGTPEAALVPRLFGCHAVVLVKGRQDFEMKAFDLRDGKLVHTLNAKDTGDLGQHGGVSATIQDGKLVLFRRDGFTTTLSR